MLLYFLNEIFSYSVYKNFIVYVDTPQPFLFKRLRLVLYFTIRIVLFTYHVPARVLSRSYRYIQIHLSRFSSNV
jgi:hypothetical protein